MAYECHEDNANLLSLNNLPFHTLSDREFCALFGCWSGRIELKDVTDLYNIFDNPDKFDECDPDMMLSAPCSNYNSVSDTNKLIKKSTRKSFSMFHCNIRRLRKNLNLLEEMLGSLEVKPDVIGITETKLNELSTSNIDLPSYTFYHTNSATNAGGAGLYVANNLCVIPRPEIKFDMNLVESCWIQIDAGNSNKPILVGCIYRHPTDNLSELTDKFNDIIKSLDHNRYQIYICGDINIDFLKYNTHPPTEQYLDMLYSNNLPPIITKPTRITEHTATLDDHIYTNSPIARVTSGIITIDLSDHLPVFCIDTIQTKKNLTGHIIEISPNSTRSLS